ncbi:putative RNA methyltransferase [Flavonifractor sp. An100]|uniref:putative RNA methyltransferase n=1 Tax=Flavonifractor sp. An100 TaxID=1965538 RepID=UPI0019D18315
MNSLFCCPLCASPLTREEGAYRCPQGHSFDLAAAGYTHLLPVNRKHSKQPGDDREMVAARAAFLEKGYYGQYILGKPANGLGNRAIYQPAAS